VVLRALAPHALGSETRVVAGAETIDLPAPGSPAVLVLHGFNDTPESVSVLARALHARGWAVRAPLLPGHGRSLGAFDTHADSTLWIGAARDAYQALARDHRRVALVGQSMGGAIATVLAAEHPDAAALVLLAPYLRAPRVAQVFARLSWVVWAVAPVVGGSSQQSLLDPEARARNLSYRGFTPRALRALVHVVDRARVALPRVRVPTLVVHSRDDVRIPVAWAEAAFARLGASDKRLEWTARGGHVIAMDYDREAVATRVAAFLAGYVEPSAPTERA
jgi:carboxylesterase